MVGPGGGGEELGRHDRSRDLDVCAGDGPASLGGGLAGEAEAGVVARVEPLPVHGEVEDEDGAGDAQPAQCPQVAGELRGQMEDGYDHVRAGPCDEPFQPVGGEPGERDAAGASVVAGAQERPVEAVVHPGGVAYRRAVEGTQSGSRAVREQPHEVDGVRLVALCAGAADEFAGHRVVSCAHARAEHQHAAGAGLPGGAPVVRGRGGREHVMLSHRRCAGETRAGRFGHP